MCIIMLYAIRRTLVNSLQLACLLKLGSCDHALHSFRLLYIRTLFAPITLTNDVHLFTLCFCGNSNKNYDPALWYVSLKLLFRRISKVSSDDEYAQAATTRTAVGSRMQMMFLFRNTRQLAVGAKKCLIQRRLVGPTRRALGSPACRWSACH